MSLFNRFTYIIAFALSLVLSLFSFANSSGGEETGSEQKPVTLLSTTSTENSGLLAYLRPLFKAAHGIDFHVLAMGTGQAIRAAKNGDGDLLLVHDKPSEISFMKQGYGENRLELMYNDFILVGPESDPAGLLGGRDVLSAFQTLAEQTSLFVSRGDNSGTHKAELRLWKRAGVKIKNLEQTSYREVGAGMGRTLNIAASLNAYTLVDRGTWLSFKNRQTLKIFVEGDARLFNQYSVITLDHDRYPHLNHRGAELLALWLASDAGQEAIANFTIGHQALFFPNHKD